MDAKANGGLRGMHAARWFFRSGMARRYVVRGAGATMLAIGMAAHAASAEPAAPAASPASAASAADPTPSTASGPAPSGPKLNVGGLYDYLPGDTSSIMKPIRNDGDETGFVAVEIKRIVFDADDHLHESPQPSDGALEDRLIVSPNRLIVPPQGARSTRILYVGKREVEQYFRVRYLPVQPSRKAGFDVSPEVERRAARAGIKVLIGYGEIVFVRPSHEHYDTRFDDTPDALRIVNHGNTTVVLDNYRVSARSHADDEPSRHFILPGRTLTVKKQDVRSIAFDLEEGRHTRHKRFDF
ncbi:hypothetical protein [Burkholderia perseverans]|uniref:hypothetical protein n=1 Tax=Burkholderia perseverans TaxID=2615214 RepID=UPI001FEF5B84|nr:hypothetical protein [Burkholderia perseverans]